MVGEQFDGWNQATATDGKYKGGDHIPGMNVGGWYDAGDFDLEEPAQLSVIQSLALGYRQFNLKYDELTVDEAAREVEMHRPDGVPDTVQQVKHGALLILAQFHNIGHAIRGTHEPDLRQYTQLGAFTIRSSAPTKPRAITRASRTIAGSSLRTTRFSSGMPSLRSLQRRIR